MKKPLIALAIAATSLTPLAMMQQATAQTAPQTATRPALPPHGNPLLNTVVQSWNLSADQTKALHEASQQFRQTLINDHKANQTPAERRTAFDKAHQTYEAAVSKVLNPAQTRAFMQLNHPPRPHVRAIGPREFHARFTPLLNSWNLNAKAKEQVFAAQDTFMKGLHQHRPGDRAALATLLKQRNASLSKVLNAKQVAAFESLTRPAPHARLHISGAPMMGKPAPQAAQDSQK
ncbi:hypothetical protein LMG33818_000866 [Halomonadaceae bacterium LMG 33818]|uniref:hypothetical protein n=1 Tax=Cernens ardua TaxID=3402176 RepID=UPI003EDC7D76